MQKALKLISPRLKILSWWIVITIIALVIQCYLIPFFMNYNPPVTA